MDFYAAVDLRGGQAVRLLRGDFAQQTSYGDPLELATSFVEGGADWLHVVDLDGARDEKRRNLSVIQSLCAMSSIPIEVGGGVRSVHDAEILLDAGVARVILGTVALENPSLALEITDLFSGRVAVGIDYRRDSSGITLGVRGWEETVAIELADAVEQFVPTQAAGIVATAIDQDGTLEGPDIVGLSALLEATSIPIVASAGVGSLNHLQTLARFISPGAGRQLSGVVVGKALVEGRFTVEEGVAACK